MPAKNNSGFGLMWIPGKRHNRHGNKHKVDKHRRQSLDNSRKAASSAFGSSSGYRPQQTPILMTDLKPEDGTLKLPALPKTDVPSDAVPGTSAASSQGDQVNESISHDPSEADKGDSVDGNDDEKKDSDKDVCGRRGSQDDDDEEPKQGCLFQCMAVAVDCCGCTIS